MHASLCRLLHEQGTVRSRDAFHYCVPAKLLLAILAAVVLLVHTQPISYIAGVAAKTTLSSADLLGLRIQLTAAGGAPLLVSIPLAFLRGALTLPGHWYKALVGIILLLAANPLMLGLGFTHLFTGNINTATTAAPIAAFLGFLDDRQTLLRFELHKILATTTASSCPAAHNFTSFLRP